MDELKTQLEVAQDAINQLRQQSYVPGVMHCAKCKFSLNRVNLYVQNGTWGAGDNKTEPCPNGCGPMWPQTWEQEAKACWKALEAQFDELQELKTAVKEHHPHGAWLWIELMDWCKKRRVPPSNYDDLFAIVRKAWELVTHWKHVKTGGLYTEVGEAKLQTATPIADMAVLKVYRGEDGNLWARPVPEFEDGRFEAV